MKLVSQANSKNIGGSNMEDNSLSHTKWKCQGAWLLSWKIDLSLYSQIKNEELLEHIDRVGVVI